LIDMPLFHKMAGAGLFIVGLLIPAVVHPLGLGLPIGGLVCILGGVIYVSGMGDEESNRLKRTGLGGFSRLGIAFFIILMCAFTVGIFLLLLGSIPMIVLPFLVALCAVYAVLMYWVYSTNR